MQVKKLSLLIVLALTLSACNKESTSNTSLPTKPSVVDDTELANEVDEAFFKQLSTAMNTIDRDRLWPGYDLTNTPLYMVRATVNDNGDLISPETAFIINPYSDIPQDNKLGENEAGSLKVVQYTDVMQAAADRLTGDNGNHVFEFKYKIKSNDYYLQRYSNDSVNIKYSLMSSDVGFIAHEAFHNYQEKHFKGNPTQEQLNPMDANELAQYPLTLKTLTTQVYLLELFKDYPNNTNKADALTALKKYAVVVESMLEADKPMEHKTSKVYRHGLNQERGEGSAQYVDIFVERDLLPIFKNKKFVKNIPLSLDKSDEDAGLGVKLSDRNSVIEYFAFESFYATGGSMMFLLNTVGYDFKKIENGTIPYEAALTVSGLDEQERSYLLADILAGTEWQAAMAGATRYMKILNK